MRKLRPVYGSQRQLDRVRPCRFRPHKYQVVAQFVQYGEVSYDAVLMRCKRKRCNQSRLFRSLHIFKEPNQ